MSAECIEHAEDSGRPGCHCPECLEHDEVVRLVCRDCEAGGEDALEFHEMHVAGSARAEALAEAHWHDNIEVEVVWTDG